MNEVTVKEIAELITYIPTKIYLYIEGAPNQIYFKWDKVIEDYGDYETNAIDIDVHKEVISLVIAERKKERNNDL